MTIDSTIHDNKFDLWPRGAGGEPLRQAFRIRYKKICCQKDVNDSEVEGRVDFEFTRYYKNTN